LARVGLAITPRQRQRRFLWREIRRVAEDDLREVADSIAAQEAREDDAYYEAVALHRDAEEKLAVAKTLDDLFVVAVADAAYGGSIGLFDWLDDLLDPTDLL
jgi:hypothetical protein